MVPVILSGTEVGRAEISKKGLYTVIDVDIENIDRILRLYVYGDGKCEYLGIPYPVGDRLKLSKKLSPSDMLSMPEEIRYISDCSEQISDSRRSDDKNAERSWIKMNGGALLCNDGDSKLIALPCRSDADIKHCRTERINGGIYMIFRY